MEYSIIFIVWYLVACGFIIVIAGERGHKQGRVFLVSFICSPLVAAVLFAAKTEEQHVYQEDAELVNP